MSDIVRDASSVKAIPTEYDGVTFRSRLEARWAVFFDTLGIKWEYEAEGYEYRQGDTFWRYLPDFHLPECATFCEVRGDIDRVDLPQLRTIAQELPQLPRQGPVRRRRARSWRRR